MTSAIQKTLPIRPNYDNYKGREELDTKQKQLETILEQEEEEEETKQCHVCRMKDAVCLNGDPFQNIACTRCEEEQFLCSFPPFPPPFSLTDVNLNPDKKGFRETLIELRKSKGKYRKLSLKSHTLYTAFQEVVTKFQQAEVECGIVQRMRETRDAEIEELKIQIQQMEQAHTQEIQQAHKSLQQAHNSLQQAHDTIQEMEQAHNTAAVMMKSKEAALMRLTHSVLTGSGANMFFMFELVRLSTGIDPWGNPSQAAHDNTGLGLNNAGAVPSWPGVVPAWSEPQEATYGLSDGERHTETAQW